MPQVNRRQLLKGVGAATGSALVAGCQGLTGGGDGGDSDELGERVPTLMYKYYPWNGGHEAIAPIVKKQIEDMGFEVEVSSLEPLTWVDKVYNDSRELHFGDWGTTASGDRLDPQEFIMDYAADNAGPGGTHDTHWVNCEYTELAHKQAREPDTEKRRELVYQAQEIFGEDYVVWPCITVYREGAVRKDQIDVKSVGKAGVQVGNYHIQINSETDKEAINMALASNVVNTLNWPTQSSGVGQVLWNHVPNSALFEYDENYELQHVLAESSSYSDDGETLTVNLRDGTFHNGDPITAEDVKFTFEHIDSYPEKYPIRKDQRFDSINAVDEKTVEFNFDGPNPVFRGRYATLIGILHKDSWVEMGADENPDNFNMSVDSFVGSGPFTVAAWDRGRQMTLEPHDGHPYYQTADHRLNWIFYQESQPRISAFKEGTVDILVTISQSFVRELKETMSDDKLKVVKLDSFAADHLNPQHTRHPTQFKEFRKAIGTGLNRKRINLVETNGKAGLQMACTLFTETHPWRAPDEYLTYYTQEPTGEQDKAEQILLDAGWGKDDDGFWHYPPDKDLSPPWPQGEQPTGDEFPCLDEDGNYAQ
jgi:peptide/nickel transport system substrate-binding protein